MHPNPTQITEEQSQWLPRKQAPCRLPQCRARGSARAAATAPAAVHLSAPAAPRPPLLPTFQQLVQAGDLPAAIYGVDCTDALGQVHIVRQ